MEGRDELRGVLNAGHTKNGKVIRLVGDQHDPRVFRVFCRRSHMVNATT